MQQIPWPYTSLGHFSGEEVSNMCKMKQCNLSQSPRLAAVCTGQRLALVDERENSRSYGTKSEESSGQERDKEWKLWLHGLSRG